MKSIVVGTDGSDTAAEAVRQASELAKRFEARLHVVSVVKPPSQLWTGAEPASLATLSVQAEEELRAQVHDLLHRVSSRLRGEGVDAEAHAGFGEPADVIIDVAEREDADLIVVGNRGMAGVKRFLLGSVPNRIAHHAPCAVMIVKTC